MISATPVEPTHTTQSLDSNDGIQLPKKPQIKKRVTLSAIPPTDMNTSTHKKLSTSNSAFPATHQISIDSVERSMMIPPCVRIEGCTPPSDSSVDDDLDQFGAR